MKKDDRPFYLKRHAWDALGFCPCGWRRVVLGQEGAITVLYMDPSGVAGTPRKCERQPRRRRRPAEQLELFTLSDGGRRRRTSP